LCEPDGDSAGELRVGTVVVIEVDMERGVAFWCAALAFSTLQRRRPPARPPVSSIRWAKTTNPPELAQ
jgi:hypothetical protein